MRAASNIDKSIIIIVYKLIYKSILMIISKLLLYFNLFKNYKDKKKL
jgi:hypothetical protein